MYLPSTRASTLIFFFSSFFFFPKRVVAGLVALTCVSLHGGLHFAGNGNIAQVGSSVLINMKRTEGYMCA